MSLPQEQTRYFTYILTFWEERNSDSSSSSVWRFRLEDPRIGLRQGYADLELLVAALQQEIEQESERKSEGKI